MRMEAVLGSAARRGTEKPRCVRVLEAFGVLQNMCGVRASSYIGPPSSSLRAASPCSQTRARGHLSASPSSGSGDTRAYTSSDLREARHGQGNDHEY